MVFRDKYGRVPLCNTAGKNFTPTNEFELFAKKRLRNILDNLAEHGVSRAGVIAETTDRE